MKIRDEAYLTYVIITTLIAMAPSIDTPLHGLASFKHLIIYIVRPSSLN